MKEKFDLSLDNRQIVSLLIAGIVVMGAVFVLGVVVGKKLADNKQTAAAQDLLSALDAKAEALDKVQQEPALTFPDELTRRSPSEPALPAQAPKPAAKPAPEKAVAEKAPADKAPEKLAEAAAPSIEPKAEPSTEAKVEAKVEAKAAQAEIEKPAATKPAEAPRGKVAEAPVTARTASPDGGLKSAIARAQQQQAPRHPAEATTGGAFTLQLSAYQARAEADRFAARLRDRGYAPYIVAAQVPGKGTWHRVRMGSFATKEAAARYLADFKRETQLPAFVTPR
ncbi:MULTISPECIES: SPOR domain-containing protein [Myxococcaceae]|uniref:SPOR domain-containing protein n=1 Tax=Myxococcaceae TaxID=31 RepID=UPI001E421F17|nr:MULTISPECIES: SPOR domain-containing protein [Myxococcaceae]